MSKFPTRASIEANPGVETFQGGQVFTGNGITAFRLLAMKSALSMELKGMRLSRGPSVFGRIKAEFKLKGSKQKVYDQFCAKLREAGVLRDPPAKPLNRPSPLIPELRKTRKQRENPTLLEQEYAEEVAAGNHDGSV